MKKLSCVMAAAMLILAVAGCGSDKAAEQSSGLNVEPIGQETNAEVASEDVTLAVPQVKDGVTRPGEDAIEVYFEWAPVEGADGYEVAEKNKFYEEETWREPEVVSETAGTDYITSAQEYFDFQIKVRAFKGEGASRVYSDWSSEAFGTTAEE